MFIVYYNYCSTDWDFPFKEFRTFADEDLAKEWYKIVRADSRVTDLQLGIIHKVFDHAAQRWTELET